MIGSSLMFLSNIKDLNKTRIIFLFSWIVYMLYNSNLYLGILFPIINLSLVILISIIGIKIKNDKNNIFYSIFSILIWSLAIDIICYFLYPQMTNGFNILQYIYNGFLFNYKNILLNSFICLIIKVSVLIYRYIKNNNYKEYDYKTYIYNI